MLLYLVCYLYGFGILCAYTEIHSLDLELGDMV